MKPPFLRPLGQFELHTPSRLDTALDLLASLGEKAQPLAGGTDLLVQMKQGLRTPSHLVSIGGLDSLSQWKREDEWIEVGAAVKLSDLAEEGFFTRYLPVLRETARIMGSPQVRNRATIGGNICNASPSADLSPPLVALGAEVSMKSVAGERTLSLEEFFSGPGQTVVRSGELLTGIRIHDPPEGTAASYIRLTARAVLDIAITGVASYLEVDDRHTIRDARIVLGAAAPTPLRVPRAEAILVGEKFSSKVVQRAAEAAMQSSLPIDDVRSSASYRRAMVRALTERSLQSAYRRTGKNR
jgi:carbon-monoxide dehydrogenase medium subunit